MGNTPWLNGKVLDWGIEVSKFEIQSRYDVQFPV